MKKSYEESMNNFYKGRFDEVKSWIQKDHKNIKVYKLKKHFETNYNSDSNTLFINEKDLKKDSYKDILKALYKKKK